MFLKIVRELRPDMELSGLDYDKNAIDYAKTVSDFDLRHGNVESLPYKNETFDTVVCMETLEHVSGLEKAVDEMLRVLRSDGKLIITVPVETGLVGTMKRFGRKILNREDTHEHFDVKRLENHLSSKITYTWNAPFGLGKLYVVKK
jgi:ubiquinone/menaquinone biosynthesis C-methylase UbiE